MRSAVFFFGGALLAGVLAGCFGLFPWDKPLDWEYHDHPLALYVRTVNHALDTTGIASCVLRVNGYTYSRPGGYEGDMNYDFTFPLPKNMDVEFAWPDTEWHVYRTVVHHLVGYQLEKGGDTTRLSNLTPHDWSMTLNVGLSDGRGKLKTGRQLHTYCHGFSNFPDEVGGDSVIEVELVCDLSRLGKVYASSIDTSLHLDQSAISRRRR